MILFGAKKTKTEKKYVTFKGGRPDGRTVYNYIRGKDFFTSKDIRAFTGAGEGSVQGILTTLSLTYPIYEKSYGKYALLKDEDL